MRIVVIAQLLTDEGIVQWGYSHDEVVVPTDDNQLNVLTAAGRIERELANARDAISDQAGIDIEAMAAEAAKQ